MQVALESPALVIAGLYEPGARAAHLVELRADLGVQPLVLNGHARRGAGGTDQGRVERRVVYQRGQRLVVPLDHRVPPLLVRGDRERCRDSVGVDPSVRTVDRVDDVDRWVAEGAGEQG